MKKLDIETITTGDQLAEDLRMKDGSLILAKGAELSDSMIVRLRKMGVTELVIEDRGDFKTDNAEIALAALEHRFQGLEDNPVMMELKNTVHQLITPENQT